MSFKKILHFSLGPVLTALVGLITLPVMSWLFSSEDIGRYALIQVLVSFSLLFFTLGLDQAYVREYHDAKDRSAFLVSFSLPGLILLLVASALVGFYSSEFIELWFNFEWYFAYILVCIILLTNYLIRFLQIESRMSERALLYSVVQVLPRFLFLVSVVAASLYDFNDFKYILLGFTASYVITFSFVAWKVIPSISAINLSNFDKMLVQKVLSYASPLVISSLAYWGLVSIDRLLLKEYSGLGELANYALAVNLAGVAMIFQQVFSTIWTPYVYKVNSYGGDTSVFNTFVKLVRDAVVIIFSLVLLFKPLVSYFLPDSYVSVQYLLSSCIVAPLMYMLSECTKVGIGITKKTKYSVASAILSLIVALGFNILLIPHLGAPGAAIATMSAFMVFYVLRSEFSRKVWKPVYQRRDYFVISALLVCASIDALLQEKAKLWVGLSAVCLLLFALSRVRVRANQYLVILRKPK
ncbi:oligosaccharide flippase family protein [Pseudoalteromonas sp. R3]|uniref:lipopolysaccharide biosynthesis protein n=1 Tax=Pseudoalteromonas sp. R3 TaxID=1709477 RepID=UPI0006B61D97|nr:oligosaccharide flippase family protein [Pseudoalteromonas sp. R3]AZZ99586.1 hypothetical protein ELR70_22470 [Pseudoalteromonas sp. R3]